MTVSAEFRAAQALGVSSATRLKKAPITNPDTSADVYFGPTVPAGHEANWVQTIPGKGWNVLLRLYGPLQPWCEKSWRPGKMSVLARHRRLQEKGVWCSFQWKSNTMRDPYGRIREKPEKREYG